MLAPSLSLHTSLHLPPTNPRSLTSLAASPTPQSPRCRTEPLPRQRLGPQRGNGPSSTPPTTTPHRGPRNARTLLLRDLRRRPPQPAHDAQHHDRLHGQPARQRAEAPGRDAAGVSGRLSFSFFFFFPFSFF